MNIPAADADNTKNKISAGGDRFEYGTDYNVSV